MSTEIASAAEILDIDDETYHALTDSVSNSQLKVFAEDPALYKGRFLDKIYRDRPSADREFGSAFHAMVLKPGGLDCYVRAPREVLSPSGRKTGKKWKAFAEQNPGKIVWCPGTTAAPDDTEKMASMVESIKADPKAACILGDYADLIHERVILWTCLDTGVKRRAKLDLAVGVKAGKVFVADVKTTSCDCSEQALAGEIWRWRYDRQAAFYQDAAEALWGQRPPFVFIFVRKTPPYTCQVIELDDEFLELGRMAIQADLTEFRSCLETGIWRKRTAGQILKLKPPRYARYQSEWSVE